jgi:hypothetical protein
MVMTASTRPIRSDSAWLLLRTGTRQKMRGVMLLYPDKLAGVPVTVEYWGMFLGGLIGGLAYPSYGIGWGLALIAGLWLGQATGKAIDRKLAVKAIADGPEAATIIPLELVTSVRIDRSTKLGGMVSIGTMVVTTAGGTEYGFRVRGRSGSMQASIATALAGLGREVRATTEGLAITPRAAGDGA